jgi:hypothetical protein
MVLGNLLRPKKKVIATKKEGYCDQKRGFTTTKKESIRFNCDQKRRLIIKIMIIQRNALIRLLIIYACLLFICRKFSGF